MAPKPVCGPLCGRLRRRAPVPDLLTASIPLTRGAVIGAVALPLIASRERAAALRATHDLAAQPAPCWKNLFTVEVGVLSRRHERPAKRARAGAQFRHREPLRVAYCLRHDGIQDDITQALVGIRSTEKLSLRCRDVLRNPLQHFEGREGGRSNHVSFSFSGPAGHAVAPGRAVVLDSARVPSDGIRDSRLKNPHVRRRRGAPLGIATPLANPRPERLKVPGCLDVCAQLSALLGARVLPPAGCRRLLLRHGAPRRSPERERGAGCHVWGNRDRLAGRARALLF